MRHNLSINTYFRTLARQHRPRYRFDGTTPLDFARWREALLPEVKASLGRMPRKVPLDAELKAEWREDGLIKQRVLFAVEEGLSAAAYVFRPTGAAGRLPAILACHGHGPFGKDAVMGSRRTTELRTHISELNYDYGLQMAKAGFVTIAIDWRGFGERDDRRKPHFNNPWPWRQDGALCEQHYLRANILGMTVLGMDIHDGMCALDYLCQQEFVDPKRIGAMGLSFGGTMTTWMAIMDERVRAADVICYSDRFASFGMRDVNICGSQIAPRLFELCDVPDLQGLIASRPLLVEIGVQDDCFLVDDAMSCYHELAKIYAAAGAAEKLQLDLFEGGHRWGANRSVEFFRKYL